MTNVIDTIVRSCPDRALERFEEISYLLKENNAAQLEDFIKTNDARLYAQHDADSAAATSESLGSLGQMFPAG